MNSKLTSTSVGGCLTPLQRVSHVVRIFLWGCMVFVIRFEVMCLWQQFQSMASRGRAVNPGWEIDRVAIVLFASTIGYHCILLAWYWFLARLFGFYAKGEIFSVEPIRCIRWAGILCIAGWAFRSVQNLAVPAWQQSTHAVAALPGPVAVKVRGFNMGFFDADFGSGINFGVLAAGIVIVLIASIMAEGRKLQEEQALTI